MPGECLAADLLTKALDRVRFSQLLPILLQPNAEQNSHNDQTTKAYSSNSMGDGPGQENNTTTPGQPNFGNVPSKFADSLLDPQQSEVYKVIRSVGKMGSPQIFQIGNTQIFILCPEHNIARSFHVDHSKRKVSVENCYQCLESEKGMNSGPDVRARSKDSHLVVIRHSVTHPGGSDVLMNHVVGVLAEDQIFEAIVVNDITQSCSTCRGHDLEEQKIKSEQTRKTAKTSHKRKISKARINPRVVGEIKNYYKGAENEAKNGLIFYNNKVLPTSSLQTFESAPRTATKFLEIIKTKAKMIERAHIVVKELHNSYIDFIKTTNSEEKKLLGNWSVLNKIKDDMTSLKEEGIDSIIIEQVVDPLIKVLVNGLTNNMKSIVRGDVQYSQPPFSAIQIPMSMRLQQTSSQSASSVGSSVSANSSVSNTVTRMEESRPPIPFEALAIAELTTSQNVNNLPEPNTLPDVSNLPVAQLLQESDGFLNQRNIIMGSPDGSPIGSPFAGIESPLRDVGSTLILGPEEMFEIGPT
jgi:hypothetical protein